MRRQWNGWGFEDDHTRLGAGGRAYLEARVGAASPVRSVALAEVVAAVPASRLGAHRLLDLDPETRVRHARGQSLPDLLDLRYGRLAAVPDAVAGPADRADLRAIIDHARTVGARLIPYGGGTSVVGGVTARTSGDPLITVDLSRLSGITALDGRSGLVTAGAGTAGPALAQALAPHGLTVGHEPQSWELATVGGWVAARGSGLRSQGMGRIEQLYAGGTLEAPAGTLDLPPFPASAAGPDLRQLVLGSEGRLGFLADVVLRASPIGEVDRFDAWAMPGWDEAVEAARSLARSRPGLSSLRVSTPAETRALLAFADRPRQIGALTTYLRLRRRRRDWCLLLAGASGPERTVKAARGEAGSVLKAHGGIALPVFADAWYRARFRSPYLRNALLGAGYGAETLETATDWARVPDLLARVEAAIGTALRPRGERVHVFTHLSHLYPSGSSLYLTYLFRLAATPEESLDRALAIKRAASDVISGEGATISHHHGVGSEHAPYLAAEKGPLGMAVLEAVVRTFDPEGLMNPGVLLPDPAA
ncbi:MAG TPA: FAD-binding oxidoreductase [Candidatus Limnocylindrales bacterium]|nr:FAD-binding oxidoreductase [Candidatus Limnocylindrales bacterium]